MTQEETLHLLRLSRAYCAEKLLWFAPALYKTKIILTKQVGVAAIDTNYNIYFNPTAVDTIQQHSTDLTDTMAQLGFLWIHEIAHVLRCHADRATDISAAPRLWNIAADLEINDGNWVGLKMPVAIPGLLPEKFNFPNGKLAEWYYHTIQQDKDSQDKVLGACQGNGGQPSDNKGNGGQSLDNKGSGTQSSDNKENTWDEGSGIHGESRPWETTGEQQQLHGIDRQLVEKEVAQKLKEHRKHIGNLPGSWERWIEEVLSSKTDWRQLLQHRMSTAIATGIGLRVDYSFARPSRRQAVYYPIITPSFAGERSGRIAVVVDTSGSMGGRELGQSVAEVCKVLEDFKLPVTVIPCDAKAYEPIVLNRPSDRFKVQQLKGGGGTDMVAGIAAALALKPAPDSVLVLTDGYTPYPSSPYKTPVLFGIIKKDLTTSTPLPNFPPWSKSAVVDILISSK